MALSRIFLAVFKLYETVIENNINDVYPSLQGKYLNSIHYEKVAMRMRIFLPTWDRRDSVPCPKSLIRGRYTEGQRLDPVFIPEGIPFN